LLFDIKARLAETHFIALAQTKYYNPTKSFRLAIDRNFEKKDNNDCPLNVFHIAPLHQT